MKQAKLYLNFLQGTFNKTLEGAAAKIYTIFHFKQIILETVLVQTFLKAPMI
jgi:hypothetical protein